MNKYPSSDNIYNEIFNFLSSIEIYKEEINKKNNFFLK